MWELQHRHTYSKQFEIAKKNKVKLPDEIANVPTLPQYLQWIKGAFISLSTCRQIGFGVGQIPWTAVNEYAIRLRLNDNDFDYFEKMIYGIDNAYVAYLNKDKNESPKPDK